VVPAAISGAQSPYVEFAARGSVQQSFYDTSQQGGAWCYRLVIGVAETSLLCDVYGMALLSHVP
jgi:hypothetical protein